MSRFRPDIQALRAIAVLLVLAFHVWPTRITGGFVGVDVFFVISGYLITGHLVREVASTGRVDLPAFYARRARRLLPAASLTLVAVCFATWLWMPAFTWPTVAADMAASALYAENWALVRRSVDYLAQGQTPSPLQHFWSLAVEEQFYLGWPLLVAGVAAAWARRANRKPAALPGLAPPAPPPRRAYAAPMGALCGLSFLASLLYARVSPAAGYFMTHTRLHELGLGGLVSVWAARGRARPYASVKLCKSATHPTSQHWPRTLCAAAGLVAIGASGCLFTARLPFPGAAALVPVLGAAAVIAAGEGAEPASQAHALAPVLAHPWLQYGGDISYSLYLAHWPVVVMYPFVTGREVDGALADGVTVLALSWALAHACKRGWEDRFRSGGSAGEPPSRAKDVTGAVTLTIGMMLAVVLLSFGLHRQALQLEASPRPGADPVLLQTGHLNASTQAARPRKEVDVARLNDRAQKACGFFVGSQGTPKAANSSRHFPGADIALHGCPVINSLPISEARPPVERASVDVHRVFREPSCMTRPFDDAELKVCEAERPENASAPSRRPHVVLIGDSHAAHWMPAFEALSRRTGIRFTCLTKASCPPTAGIAAGENHAPKLRCRDWVGKAVDWVLREKPSAVVLSSHDYEAASKNASHPTELADGVVRIARQMIAADIPVLGIKATPVMKSKAPQCLAMTEARSPGSHDVDACSTPQSMALSHPNNPIDQAAKMYPIMRLLSFDDILCHNKVCPPMIGNVIVYWDWHHITATFSATLATALQKKLESAAPHLFDLQ